MVQRYDIVDICADNGPVYEKDPDGEIVKYTDHLAALDQVKCVLCDRKAVRHCSYHIQKEIDAALDQRNKDIADMMAKKLLGLVMPQIRETIDDLIRDFGKEE